MKDKIYAVIMVTVIATFLIGCSKEVPKCSDDRSTTLVRKIILDQIGGSEGLSEKEIQENMKIEFPRASAFDEKIKKYSCEAKLVAGDAYQLPITYDSQLDDKGQHIVSVRGISGADLFGVKSGLIEGIKKSRATKSEAAPQPQQTVPQTQQTQQSSEMKWSPSFDCAKVSTGSERLICSNKELSEVDVQLAHAYKAALKNSPDKDGLKRQQGAWLKNERDACSDAESMLKVYKERIAQLSR